MLPQDYGLTLILDRNAFLVDLVPEKIGVVLKLDSVAGSEKLWSGHDLLAFNTWHWWGYKGAQQPLVHVPTILIIFLSIPYLRAKLKNP